MSVQKLRSLVEACSGASDEDLQRVVSLYVRCLSEGVRSTLAQTSFSHSDQFHASAVDADLQKVVSSYVSCVSEGVRSKLAQTSCSSSDQLHPSAVVATLLSGEQVLADTSEAKSIRDIRCAIAAQVGSFPNRVKLIHGYSGATLGDDQDLCCLAPDGCVTAILSPKNLHSLCRIRPLSKRENDIEAKIAVRAAGERNVKLQTSNGASNIYPFDACFDCGSQEDIFGFCSRVVPLALQGERACVIAYGQTGAGKTYTMFGPKVAAHDTSLGDAGVVPRIAHAIFADPCFQGQDVKISMMELYNEKLNDLLGDDRHAELKVRMAKDGSMFCENLTEVVCSSCEDMCKQILDAETRRLVAATMMGSMSSRSSLICQVTIMPKDASMGPCKVGKLVLVDPAGSERVSKHATLKESTKINQCHSALCHVLRAYAQGNKLIPYRDSKLTMLLRDCLANAFVIIACSPADTNEDETENSFRFAQRISR